MAERRPLVLIDGTPAELPSGDTAPVASHTHAGSDVTSAVANATTAANCSRSVVAGTGLTGGGELTANRTLTVAYGTTSGTACQGNDARLSDARTPTAHTHLASTISDSTEAGRALLTAADAAAQRTSLGLVKQASATDYTSGRVALVDYLPRIAPINDIGTAGGIGFGVGICPPNKLPTGMYPLPGHDQLGHDNYGNYVTSNGSIMVYVPKHYYRIGGIDSPHYPVYGSNCVDILPASAFANRAAAIAAGWALPRAFIDGGQEILGVFVDKYLASALGTGDCVSLPGVEPLSLTPTAGYSRTQGMTGCTGIFADAVVLGRARGTGFHCASIFQYSALALLSLAHGQAANSAVHCAWYDPAGAINFPKGCNNNALRDVNDASVIYESAGAAAASKPKTRAIAHFAKTTHNGQECGIADTNGSLWEVALGITSPGTSATSTTQILNGTAWALKESVAMAAITPGFGGATDAWGTSASLATLYDEYADLLPWGATQDAWIRFGNGANAVLSPDAEGIDFVRASGGIGPTIDAYSAGGTNLFGLDGNYSYNRQNLFPLVGGAWGSTSAAGTFARHWGGHRSSPSYLHGFRVALAAY